MTHEEIELLKRIVILAEEWVPPATEGCPCEDCSRWAGCSQDLSHAKELIERLENAE